RRPSAIAAKAMTDGPRPRQPAGRPRRGDPRGGDPPQRGVPPLPGAPETRRPEVPGDLDAERDAARAGGPSRAELPRRGLLEEGAPGSPSDVSARTYGRRYKMEGKPRQLLGALARGRSRSRFVDVKLPRRPRSPFRFLSATSPAPRAWPTGRLGRGASFGKSPACRRGSWCAGSEGRPLCRNAVRWNDVE